MPKTWTIVQFWKQCVRRYQPYIMLKNIILQSIRKYKLCAMLKIVNLMLLIKTMCIYTGRCQSCIIYENYKQLMLKDINLIPQLKTTME